MAFVGIVSIVGRRNGETVIADPFGSGIGVS